ncbi:hypothetical protein ADK67_14495 [Saccharothrix sp. NRRL B-16348]|uniref:hypothetical protein n=1 Tax=Saccharothrix sp. NRRL B-16348 TaxID=1415542 RepID=UPI0006B04153|nr:hypothetical protein [Saccharothrix sp. NRRL B-16348]KOX27039.1 hypothetical protein ADK67_14495 [Saccharothrix sp. NRRL B-16348]
MELLENLPAPRRSTTLFSDTTGQPATGPDINKAISAFVAFANDIAARHHLPGIAEDPTGITAGRLRRTIGPFIRNRPDGAFGLAVVYGHADGVIGAAYGGMKQSGSTRFLPRDTADHITATLNNLAASLAAGGGISGPAARHAVDAAATFAGAILTTKDWKKMLADPGIQAYDNPDTAVGCRFDPTTNPPCLNDTAQDARTEPDLANCQPHCPNRFHTDHHARDHQRLARQLDAWADLAPGPEAIRLRITATGHRTTADRHWATRIGPDGTPLPPPTDTASFPDSR